MYLTKMSPIITLFMLGLLSSCQKGKEKRGFVFRK